MPISKEDEINQVDFKRPHVVILGAGASFAAFPAGEKNGLRLPLMENLIDELGLRERIESSGLKFNTNNFETIYSQIHASPEQQPLKDKLEVAVYRYFKSMELPDEPTLYDHLVLSLRGKDVIATFNWDPFLTQAMARNSKFFKLPHTLFLHGNVAVGSCPNKHRPGINGGLCHRCNARLIPTDLLYPIKDKDYNLNGFISAQWHNLGLALEDAFMLTILGYGAPSSDAGAVKLLKNAWGDINKRNLEQTEIIDVREKDDLVSTWNPFIHSHHYDIRDDFYNSWIANHPRRSCEACWNQNMEIESIEDNPLPKNAGFAELWEWYGKLKPAEDLARL